MGRRKQSRGRGQGGHQDGGSSCRVQSPHSANGPGVLTEGHLLGASRTQPTTPVLSPRVLFLPVLLLGSQKGLQGNLSAQGGKEW